MQEALGNAKGVKEDDITAVGSISGFSAEAKQEGTDREPKDLYVQGVDEGYSDSTLYGFNTTAAEYDSAREVWTAVQEEPNTAVVSASLAPARTNFSLGTPEPPIKLTGFYQEDKTLPDDLYIEVEDPRSGETPDLRVIGVVEDTVFYAGSVTTSRTALDSLAGTPVPPQSYVFRLKDGANAAATAEDLERGFVRSGLQAQDLGQEIRDSASAKDILNDLHTGFMGLGLLVGIAALGSSQPVPWSRGGSRSGCSVLWASRRARCGSPSSWSLPSSPSWASALP
jgi:putative ABC transport system permease protein